MSVAKQTAWSIEFVVFKQCTRAHTSARRAKWYHPIKLWEWKHSLLFTMTWKTFRLPAHTLVSDSSCVSTALAGRYTLSFPSLREVVRACIVGINYTAATAAVQRLMNELLLSANAARRTRTNFANKEKNEAVRLAHFSYLTYGENLRRVDMRAPLYLFTLFSCVICRLF